MNEDQAADILDYLLQAAYELDEAKAAAALFAHEDNDAASLRELIINLTSELLRLIYERFPDMLPFETFPEINSSLSWEDVSLPLSASEKDIERDHFLRHETAMAEDGYGRLERG
ncbi:MAG: hypothetical protein HY852_14715 [Bradyrhizobium sp.]|uniref:hypothetical protein n=1 Tax=Bradyrhizobium sp. TaxID=376 RepID=UPI0025C33842|nr:hypothetical protein [Bradyrhizobium sp.]MBI5263060.1 hypothetical protein [Bradyrhizobium sp.]